MANVEFPKQTSLHPVSQNAQMGETSSTEARSVVIGEKSIQIDQAAIGVNRSSIPPPTGQEVPPATIERMVETAATPAVVSTVLSILEKGIMPGGGVRSADAAHIHRVCINVNRSMADLEDAIKLPARGALPLSLERENDPLLPRLETRTMELSSVTRRLMAHYDSTREVDPKLMKQKGELETITRENDGEIWSHLQDRVESSALIVMTGDRLSLDDTSDPRQIEELLSSGKGEHWLKGTIVPGSFSHIILPDLPQYRYHEDTLRAAAGNSTQILFTPTVEGKVHYHQAGSQPIKVLLNHPNYLGTLKEIWRAQQKPGELCITHITRSSS